MFAKVSDAASDALRVLDALDIAILAEDDDLLAVAKPAGLVVHPAYRHPDGTLTDAVFAYSDRIGLSRPWLLHRLDRETSGVVLFARTELARRALVRQFQQRLVTKRYLAVVRGRLLANTGKINAPLCRDPEDRRRVVILDAGKPASTHYQVLATRGDFSLVLVEPLTGRTHQIRAHLAGQGTPLAGDAVYGGATEATDAAGIGRTLLHAWEVAFRHPATGSPCVVRAPIPSDMGAVLSMLELWDGITTLPELSQDHLDESC